MKVSTRHILVIVLLVCTSLNYATAGEDYYGILGVPKDADERSIRKAFKKLALKYHPDKNKDDTKAHDLFVKINRAYEVLKDEELRKKYDLFGEAGLKDEQFGGSGNFRSWNFYRDNFGIYDEDAEIVTLGKSEFDQSVSNSDDIWFVNFYSGQCSHCHDLAPEWRKLAQDLEGVIRIGAVNCEDSWMLCREQGIFGYPSLVLYPRVSYINDLRILTFVVTITAYIGLIVYLISKCRQSKEEKKWKRFERTASKEYNIGFRGKKKDALDGNQNHPTGEATLIHRSPGPDGQIYTSIVHEKPKPGLLPA